MQVVRSPGRDEMRTHHTVSFWKAFVGRNFRLCDSFVKRTPGQVYVGLGFHSCLATCHGFDCSECTVVLPLPAKIKQRGFHDRRKKVRNPFCCNSVVRSQTDRARLGQAQSGEGRSSRKRYQPGGVYPECQEVDVDRVSRCPQTLAEVYRADCDSVGDRNLIKCPLVCRN